MQSPLDSKNAGARSFDDAQIAEKSPTAEKSRGLPPYYLVKGQTPGPAP
jgi:hypothetical protein